MGSDLIIILISMLFSAFFSGMEIAFVSSNKLRIELEKKQGKLSSNIISIFTQNPAQFISTMLVGNNIALVIYGIVMAKLLETPIQIFIDNEFSVLIIQTVLSTFLILITAEFLPKAIFRKIPNSALNIFALPVFLFYILFYPLTKFTIWLSHGIIRVILHTKIDNDDSQLIFHKIDLDNFLTESTNNQHDVHEIEHDIRIFQNALDFSSIKLRECIVPRTDLAALEITKSVDDIRLKFIETGFSKILIYEDNIDNIVGYIHSSEMFKKPLTLRDCLNTIPIVPETMAANKLLGTFIKQRKSIALVVDEFGGTAGIVTIEDIMEEIFGEINDEYDSDDVEHKELKISDHEYILSGRLEIDYLNEKYNLRIPESDDYETIAGFIINNHESIPNINETIQIRPYVIKVLKATSTRIQLVNLKLRDIEASSNVKN